VTFGPPSASDVCCGSRALGLVVALSLAILAAPLATAAQQPGKVPRIGVLSVFSPQGPSPADGLRRGLRELGYVEGRNINVEWRLVDGRVERYPDLAAELVRLKVDVIVAGGDSPVSAARKATRTIPIVMVHATDPVESGFAASLARPGGNITGLSTQSTELVGKRLQLLREAVPNVSRMVVLLDPKFPGSRQQAMEAELAAPSLGLQLRLMEARSQDELESSFSAMARQGAGAALVLGSGLFFSHRALIAEAAVKSRLATMCMTRAYAEARCLISYGASFTDLYRRAAYFVDRILKGAKPADLPVEQPTKFELVINLETAKALGLTIPQSLLLRADLVIH